DAINQNIAIARSRSTVLSRLGIAPDGYFLVTCHREENVDDPDRLLGVLAARSAAYRAAGLSRFSLPAGARPSISHGLGRGVAGELRAAGAVRGTAGESGMAGD